MRAWIKSVGRVGCACIAVLTAAILAAPIAAADDHFVPVPETGMPGALSLSSSVYPLDFPALKPAETFSWQIGVTLSDKPVATAALQLTAASAVTGSHIIAVEECAVPWQGASGLNQVLSCPSGAIHRVRATVLSELRGNVRIQLSDLRTGTSPYLMFRLERSAVPVTPEGASELRLGIGVTAMGDDDAGTVPRGEGAAPELLGDTGAAVLPALFAGAGLLLLGAVVLIVTRRTDRSG
ncbi:hypothetical protein [Arthrobacter cavernae]|uniref:hypothetical protein n=1 Tax=Arthrobacter cavernae TaxID=2817681 RepID=UPI0027DD681B|nr:hypothetical protein [Arthrobacter cavernae]